jgi:hypothetical protein
MCIHKRSLQNGENGKQWNFFFFNHCMKNHTSFQFEHITWKFNIRYRLLIIDNGNICG